MPRSTRTGLCLHAAVSALLDEDELLLADVQTSGGLLAAGELPGAPVIGELVPRDEHLRKLR